MVAYWYTNHCKTSASAMIFLVILLNLLPACRLDEIQMIHRIEYKTSLKGPNITASDGTIPLWKSRGNVVASVNRIRLVPALPNQRGALWSNRLFAAYDWTIDVRFMISGKDPVGTEGMAFWFVSHPLGEGDAFGSSTTWHGLCVFLDTYSNLWKKNLQMVGSIVNNGSFTYTKALDGAGLLNSASYAHYRNSKRPCRLKITYFKKALTIEFVHGDSGNHDYTLLSKKENIELPHSGYFGISAASGNSHPDDHDVFQFIVHVIIDKQVAVQHDEKTREMLAQYHRSAVEMDAERDKFAEEHPEITDQERSDEFVLEDITNLLDRLEERMNSNPEAVDHILDDLKIVLHKIQKIVRDHPELNEDTLKKVINLFEKTKSDLREKRSGADQTLANLRYMLNQLEFLIRGYTEIDTQSLSNLENDAINDMLKIMRSIEAKVIRINRIQDAIIEKSAGNYGHQTLNDENRHFLGRLIHDTGKTLDLLEQIRENQKDLVWGKKACRLLYFLILISLFKFLVQLYNKVRKPKMEKKLY
ncbi:hypothetical protein ACOME3_004595 [Neoechinorhynchus agilis]